MSPRGNDDRRRWRRNQSRVSELTIRAGEAVSEEAVVLDESLTGIALLVKDAAAFRVDQEVRLTRGNREVPATIKHIRRRETGDYHLGLEWGPCEVKPASLLLLVGSDTPSAR